MQVFLFFTFFRSHSTSYYAKNNESFFPLPSTSKLSDTKNFICFNSLNSNKQIRKTSTPPTLKRRAQTLFECEVCQQQGEVLIKCDECFEKNEGGTTLCYHITCAPLNDISFERRLSPPYIVGICAFHRASHGIINFLKYLSLQTII